MNRIHTEPEKVFVRGWENAAGKLRGKRSATAGTKFTKPRTKTFLGSVDQPFSPIDQIDLRYVKTNH